MAIEPNDRVAIEGLHYPCCFSTDGTDVDGFMRCRVEERFEGFLSPFGDFETREALRDFEHEQTHGGTADGKRHFCSNLVIREGDDAGSVLGTSYMAVVDVVNAPRIVATSKYTDSIVRRTAGGWRFVRRDLAVDPGFEKIQGEG